VAKRTVSSGLGSLGSGAITAVALAVQTGLAAVVGILIAHRFGRTTRTDGFFAAYGVFVVLVLAATSARVVVLPPLARARLERRLGAETAAYARTLGFVAIPVLVVAIFAAHPVASLLTGFGPTPARAAAAAVLPWMVVAAIGQFYAGLVASALAALDQYVVSAIGYGVGSIAGLALILARIDADGIAVIAWGMALNAGISLAIPAVWLALRARAEQMPVRGVGPGGSRVGSRFGELARGVSLPLALQAAYLVCLALASRRGIGSATTFGYAYLIGSALVAVTAGSLGLVTSVPVTRAGLDPPGVAKHVDSSSWFALVGVAAAAGTFAVAGEQIVHALLGPGYQANVGKQLGGVVVAFAPWMVAAVGVSVIFPLVFIQRMRGRLALIAVGLVALHVPLAFAAERIAGLYGLAVVLALTTGLGVVAMLVDLHAARLTLEELGRAAFVVAAIAAVAYVAPGVLLRAVPAAIVGGITFATLIAIIRPAGLRSSWRYLRALG
jgi:hypothetical protein